VIPDADYCRSADTGNAPNPAPDRVLSVAISRSIGRLREAWDADAEELSELVELLLEVLEFAKAKPYARDMERLWPWIVLPGEYVSEKHRDN